MFWDELKNFFKKKRNVAVMAAAVSAPSAFAQEKAQKDDSQTPIEQVVIDEVVINNQVYPTINGQPVHGNTYSNLEEDLKNYYDDQKEAFENRETKVKTDTLSLECFAFKRQLAYYDFAEKNITINHISGSSEDDVLYYVEQNYMNMSLEEQAQKAQNISFRLAKYNDKNSVEYQAVLAHETQHMINDKNNIYAPGLSVAQYGMLNQYDEVSAKLAELLVVEHDVQKQIKSGVSPHEALKIFDRQDFSDFAFFKNLILKKESMKKDDYAFEVFNGVFDAWQKNYQKIYENQVIFSMEAKCEEYDAASLAIGNEKEFDKRVEQIFKNIKENQLLKDLNIKTEDFSKFLSAQKMPLSDKVQKKADDLMLHYTGMMPEFAQNLSRQMPGNEKKDASNLLKILSGQSVKPSVAKKINLKTKSSMALFNNMILQKKGLKR